MSAATPPAGGTSRTLLSYPERLAVVRLGPGSEVPAWAESSSVFAVIATAAETTVVCAGRDVPTKARHAGPYTAFVVDGTLDPAEVGVLHALLGPLVASDVPVMTLSTFDTDWLLVPTDRAETAAEAWRASGHEVRAAPVAEPPPDRPRKRKK